MRLSAHRLCYDVDVTAARLKIDDALTRIASAAPGLQMPLLHGSRARNEAHAHSDWDFADQADAAFDADALLAALADRLVRAAGFRNLVAHAYERLDMTRVHLAARAGPAVVRACVAAIARAAPGPVPPEWNSPR